MDQQILSKLIFLIAYPLFNFLLLFIITYLQKLILEMQYKEGEKIESNILRFFFFLTKSIDYRREVKDIKRNI